MNYFFLTEEEKNARQTDTTYKSKLSENVKKGTLNLLEYSYMTNYYDEKGSMINSSWFLQLANKIKDKDFCKVVAEIFPSLFEMGKTDDVIKFKIKNLSDSIIKDKKHHIKFTNDQILAIEQIFDFLPDFERKAYGLYGYAGTGKTTIIVEILSFLLKKKLIKSVAFTAPTNKAVDVIKSKFRNYLKELYVSYSGKDTGENFNFEDVLDKLNENGVRIDFITIHKLLKFEMDYGAEGEMIFVRGTGASLIGQYEVIIIDECSMIPIKLVENIFSEIKKTQYGCDNFKKSPKIIFCGDPAQLPPVGEKLSIIFLNNKKQHKFEEYIKSKKEIESTGESNDAFANALVTNDDTASKSKYQALVKSILEMPCITLKKVMRSKLDNVTSVCYQIRLWTIKEIKVPVLKPYLKNGVCAYQYDGGEKIKTKWFKKCLDYYKDENSCNIILTWTNPQAMEYNQTIRNMIFGKNKTETFEVGDILMLNDFYNMDDGQDDYLTEQDNKFYTSEQIKVIKLEIVNKKVNDFSITLNKKATKLQNSKHYEGKYKQMMEIINKSTTRNYMCWKLQVKRISDNDKDNKSDAKLCTIYVIHENSADIWKKENEFISANIKKLRGILTNKFREKKITIENNIIKPLWRELHKNMVDPFAKVSYGYAITCHKGQGSNFYNVFVDVHDIIKNNNEDETKKCLYTAMTRASNELHLLLSK